MYGPKNNTAQWTKSVFFNHCAAAEMDRCAVKNYANSLHWLKKKYWSTSSQLSVRGRAVECWWYAT